MMRLLPRRSCLQTRGRCGHGPLGVQPDTVDAIDHIREIGNIGAHMEADINVIVDVDPNEAQVLIELVQLLFLEWYVARAARADGLANLKSIAEDKKGQKHVPPALENGEEPSTK